MTKIAQAVSTEFRVSIAKVKNFNHLLGDHVYSYKRLGRVGSKGEI